MCLLQVYYRYYNPRFCPHWSEVVGLNHHSAFLTTTQATFTTTHIVNNNTKSLLLIKLDCHFAKCNHHSDDPGQNPDNHYNYQSLDSYGQFSLRVIWNHLYKTNSGIQRGTLYHLRNLVNRRSLLRNVRRI